MEREALIHQKDCLVKKRKEEGLISACPQSSNCRLKSALPLSYKIQYRGENQVASLRLRHVPVSELAGGLIGIIGPYRATDLTRNQVSSWLPKLRLADTLAFPACRWLWS